MDLPEKNMKDIFLIWTAPLVDSMPLHYKAWRKALARAGAPDRVFLADANDVVRFYSMRR